MALSIKKLIVIQFALAALLAASAAAAEPIRVLFITGRNNHRWQLTTPSIRKTLEDSGRFKVDVTEKPAEITAKSLAGYDVIFNGWTGLPKTTGHLWGLDTEKAIDDFVASGKGMASFHAGSSSFYDWDGFQKIIGATWGKGTGHGRYHEFTVEVTDVDHPITRGMKNFKTTDELWHRLAVLQPTPGRRILCTAMSAKSSGGTGKAEGVAICTRFGKGRGFYTSLGHDVKALENPGCKLLMLRGIEWAATGKVTIGAGQKNNTNAGQGADAVFTAITNYKYPDSREALTAAAQFVQKAAKDPKSRQAVAAKLAAMLKSKATTDCKKFVCDQLSLVGSAAEVPILASLLGDEDLATGARAALLRIPGAQALAAMRKVLASSSPAVTTGLLSTLGERRDADSIDAISGHLGPKGPAAEAAIDALGNIGGTKALALLIKADPKASPALRLVLNDALLKCADALADAGKTAEAAEAYKILAGPDRPRHVRVAAFGGVVAAEKDKAAPMLLDALTGKDPTMRSAAIRCLGTFKGKEITRAVADKLAALPPDAQVQVIGILARRQDSGALGAITALASSKNDDVRQAALDGMGQLGDASTVKPLIAAMGNASDRPTVRRSLARLKGDGVDKALIAALTAGEPAVRAEIVAILNARNARTAADALLTIASEDSDATVRKEAIKALGGLADHRMCPELLDLLAKAKSASQRRGIINALITITRNSSKFTDEIITTLGGKFKASDDPVTKAGILAVAGGIGGAESLKFVRTAAKDADLAVRTAAVRAMGAWSDATPLKDLLAVLRTEKQLVPKTLAIRGLVALSSKAKDIPVDKLTSVYTEAMKLTSGAADTKTLLSGLAAVGSPEALKLALSYLDNKKTVNEAALAALNIADKLTATHRDTVKAAIAKVTAACKLKIVADKAAKIMTKLDKPASQTKAASSTSSSAAVAAAKLSWKQTDESIALLNGRKVVWQVNYKSKEGRPYIHPLATIDGSVLTAHRPPDHLWHRALWFSWVEINKLNYWIEDRKTGQSPGLTEIKSTKVTLAKDYSAKVEMVLSYHPPAKSEVLAEKRTMAFSTPAENGLYRIDWTSVFTATGDDAQLNRTPRPGEKGGKGHGGYAGFSIRLAKETRSWRILDSKGREAQKIHGQPGAVWVDASGKTTGGKQAGVAMFDHPSNLRHPSPWFIVKGMPYFSPAFLFNKPYTLKKSKSFTLKYRVLVHPGLADKEMLDGEFKEFAKN